MKRKVIHVIGHLKMGGAETLITNYALNIDLNKFEFIIISINKSQNTINEIKLNNKNIKIYFLEDRAKYSNSTNIYKRIVNRCCKQKYFNEIISKERPDVIHSHLYVNSYLVFSPYKNIKYFYTIHSNIKVLFSKRKIINNLSTKLLIKNREMIPIALHNNMKIQMNELFNIQNTKVLENAINLEQYKSSNLKRENILSSLNIDENTFVIGHIGRFHPVKNHIFLIELFDALQKKINDSHMLLIGDGELRNNIENLIKDRGLQDKVTFLGEITNVSEYLSVMNVFVFPSLHEGFGNVLIEAQAAGVKCFVSDTVPRETKVTNLVTFLSLDDPIIRWRDCIMNDKQTDNHNKGIYKHDIHIVLSKLQNMYRDE